MRYERACMSVPALLAGFMLKTPRHHREKTLAIHFVTGRPGAGKGLYCMKLLIEELRGTERNIVSNFALKPDELAEYLHNKFGTTYNLLERWCKITDDQIAEFYLYRGEDIPKLEAEYTETKSGLKKPVTFDITGAQEGGGVFYILDEVHLKFGARDWQMMGKATMYYSSQHRKLGDDVILATQAPKNVDNQFRSLAQDYTVLRNHGMEMLLFWKQPNIFTRQTFLDLPNKLETPMEKGSFTLDKAVADCYDTSQGVGILSRGDADKTGDRRKGLPWWTAIIAVAALMWVAVQIPKGCSNVVGGILDDTSERVTGSIMDINATRADDNATAPSLSTTNAAFTLPTNSIPTRMVANINTNTEPAPLESIQPEKTMVIGWIFKHLSDRENWELKVVLSNGATLSLREGTISEIFPTYVIDDEGNRFDLHAGKRIPLDQLVFRPSGERQID